MKTMGYKGMVIVLFSMLSWVCRRRVSDAESDECSFCQGEADGGYRQGAI